VIGEDIPVCINALKPAVNAQDNLKLLMFLNDLFLSENNTPENIVLKNIRRGSQFCLIADIQIDGQDLGDLLVEKGLARKLIQVPEQSATGNTPAMRTTTTKKTNETSIPSGDAIGEYIASKSSKVFHRDTCSHVKRMDMSKTIAFSTQATAAESGRRPCKTCKL
jgi:hypothetical protein